MAGFRKLAGNVVMMIIGAMAPPLSILYNCINAIVKPKIESFVKLGLSVISGITGSLFDTQDSSCMNLDNLGIALTEGLIADAIEIDSLSKGIEEILPLRQALAKCEVCGLHSHFYAEENGFVRCKRCIERRVDKQVSANDKIYVFSNGVYRMKEELVISPKFDTNFHRAYYGINKSKFDLNN